MSALISILIPVFNNGSRLGRTIHSLQAQTYSVWEAIAVNDASSDQTAELLDEYARHDPRIKVITHKINQGTLISRLDALAASSGRYVMCVDADDTLEPEACETLLAIAEKSQADIVGFGARLLHDDPVRDRFADTIDASRIVLNGKAVFEAAFCNHLYNWSVCLKLIRRDLFARAALDIPRFYCVSAEDFLLYTVVSFYAEKLILSGNLFYNYYFDEGITSRQYDFLGFQHFCSMFAALKEISSFLKKQTVWDEYQAAFACREKEHFEYLFERWPDKINTDAKVDSLHFLFSSYDRERVQTALLDHFGEKIVQQMEAATSDQAFPVIPKIKNKKENAARKLFHLCQRFLPTGSKQWYLIRNLRDQIRWRKYK